MDPPLRARDVFSRDEMRALTRRSDLAGFFAVGSTWAIIAATFAALARWPHPLTFAAAVVVLGGRQLALSILMHEAAHRTLFERRVLNDVLTDWLCARPMQLDVARYRKHHLRHHAHTNTALDPDLCLVDPFPTTRASLARKLVRDLTGLTGVKRLVGLTLMDLEVIDYTVSGAATRRPRAGRGPLDYLRAWVRNGAGFVLTNAVLLGILAATGHAWLYAAWMVASLTTLNVFVRIRSLAEHACTERSGGPLRNTRTTRAGLLARMTVAPIRVSFHLEHHLDMAVPYHRLPAMHRMLRERGVVPEPVGYGQVLARVGGG